MSTATRSRNGIAGSSTWIVLAAVVVVGLALIVGVKLIDVEWSGDEGINPPVIEAVMVGVDGTQGMSFASQGREINR